MNKNATIIRGVISALILAICVFWALPLDKKINLGLDLQGGMHLVFRVDTSKLSAKEKPGAQERALEILRNRIDRFGVSEPAIQPQGSDQIIIQLPGITDRERALNIIGQIALLEFKLVEDDPAVLNQITEDHVPEGYELKEYGDLKLLLKEEAELTGKYIVEAYVRIDQMQQPYVALTFNSEGAKVFAEVTSKNVKRRLAIVLDGTVKSIPIINEPIRDGSASITGVDYEEAGDLALVLNAGSLPCPLVSEEERTIGPLLGQDSIRKGVRASVIGATLVAVFMIIYYSSAGIIAVMGLGFTLVFIMGILGYLGSGAIPNVKATLTLPGIAGIILTLGMAVDANVLIFERIREELKIGKSLLFAVDSGFKKALSAILDSNITTIIAAFFLIRFGTGPIKGFGLTLIIGLLGSMFSALVFCKFIFEVLISARIIRKIHMMEFFRARDINFLKVKILCFVISGILVISGLFLFFRKDKQVYGIDFSGGELIEFQFDKAVDVNKLRTSIAEEGVFESSIQRFRNDPRIVLIRVQKDDSDQVYKALEKNFPGQYQFSRQESVGPVVGKELKKKALKAIIFALGGILLYVAIRFRHLSFGLAGVCALFHDVIIAMAFLLFSNRLIDLLIVSALLTIAGYSINDTIVIYDRIRELYPRFKKRSLGEIINMAINQTLSRTIITSLTTILVVIVLYFMGGQVLNDFAFALIVGFIAGTYSTIFIASPLVVLFQKKSL